MLFRFSTLRLLCQNSMQRVLSPTFKQHGPCVETTSRQDNTHYVLQQHTGVLNLHPVMCIGVLYCPRCVEITHEMRYKCCFNTHSSKQHTMVTLMWVISTRLFLQCSNHRMCVVAVYRRPQLPLSTFLPLLDDYLSRISHQEIPTVVLGDFNEDLLSTACSSRVVTLMTSKGFSQLVKLPTTDSGSLLDHIYYNRTATSTFVDVVDTYYSDHDATYVSLPM